MKLICIAVTTIFCLTSTHLADDVPNQIVRPAENHKDLELVESNLMHLRELQTKASDDCTRFYNRELDFFLVNISNNEPVNMRSFDLKHQSIKANALGRLDKLLHVYKDALTTARHDLRTGIEKIFSTKRDLNDKKIKEKCNQIKSKLELDAGEQLKMIPLPQTSNSLKKRAESINFKCLRSLINGLGGLPDPETIETLMAAFQKSFDLMVISVESSNNLLIESSMAKIRDAVLKNLDEVLESPSCPRNLSKLDNIIDLMASGSEKVYKDKTLQFVDENSYEASLTLFRQDIMKRKPKFIKKNQELASENIRISIDKYAEIFTKRINTTLPMDETNLNSRLSHEGSALVEDFETQYADFKDCCNYEGHLDKLKQKIQTLSREKQQEAHSAQVASKTEPSRLRKMGDRLWVISVLILRSILKDLPTLFDDIYNK